MRSKLLILFFAVVAVFIVFNRDQQDHNQFRSDKCGYYLYLPAIFIYHDLSKLAFYDSINRKYDYSLSVDNSLYPVHSNRLDKYPAGVAFFELPLFLAVNYYCRATHQYAADGFSLPYQLAGIFSNILWVILGLFVLRKFLNRYFSDHVTAFTLLCIAFGTNLYAYTAFEIGMSHSYSFFLFSCLLNLTDKWYAGKDNIRDSVAYGIITGTVAGLIFIVRPINIIAVIIPLLWRVDSLRSARERLNLFGRHYKSIITEVCVFLLVAFIQFAYWKYITGSWLYYSYKEEGFNFLHPHILNGLFSFRKGWFVYSPMVVVCFAGFYCLWKKDKQVVPALGAFFVIMIYCVFSWREWWYGGSFGCRVLIETLPVLALPLAALASTVFNARNAARKAIFYTITMAIIALNIFQTYQYSMGLIHWDRMTGEYYWKVFGRIDFDRVKNEKYLITTAEENKYDD